MMSARGIKQRIKLLSIVHLNRYIIWAGRAILLLLAQLFECGFGFRQERAAINGVMKRVMASVLCARRPLLRQRIRRRQSEFNIAPPLLNAGSLKEAGEPDGSPVGKFRLKMTTRRSVSAPSGCSGSRPSG